MSYMESVIATVQAAQDAKALAMRVLASTSAANASTANVTLANKCTSGWLLHLCGRQPSRSLSGWLIEMAWETALLAEEVIQLPPGAEGRASDCAQQAADNLHAMRVQVGQREE